MSVLKLRPPKAEHPPLHRPQGWGTRAWRRGREAGRGDAYLLYVRFKGIIPTL
jgi:hypothetical protein